MSAIRPRARSWLLTLLLRRYATQRAQFLEECKDPWLVWEAGPWKPPSSDEETVSMHGLSTREAEALAEGSDLLCFHLKPVPGEPSTFRIGRDRTNDVTINDATVSRKHLELYCNARGEWSAVEAAVPGVVKRLKSKSQLQLGGVKLTFLMPDDWVARLEAETVARQPK
jgi:hypothetical protein